MANVNLKSQTQLDHAVSRARVEADDDYFINTYGDTSINYAEQGQKGELEPMLFDFLAVVDTANNGMLGAAEIDEAADIIRISKKAKAGNSAELNYKHRPEAVAKVLAPWDADDSGSVGVSELVMAAEA